MKIGIIVAMQKELHLLLGLLGENVEVLKADGRTYYRGHIGRHEITASTCGIGKVNAALGADSMIREFAPQLVINTGVAGGVGHAGAGILDVVVGERVAYHDVWCGSGHPHGLVEGLPHFYEGALGLVGPEVWAMDKAPTRGLIASGDMFISRPEEVEAIRALYPDVCAVDMESAAIAQTCHLRGVPFLSVRVISDTPGAADNISQYADFWEDAPRESMDTLALLLENIE